MTSVREIIIIIAGGVSKFNEVSILKMGGNNFVYMLSFANTYYE